MRFWWWKKRDPEEPADHALGRSRGGFSTKIHIICNSAGCPLHFHLTAGQAHESTTVDVLLDETDKAVRDNMGAPVAWPLALAGDKGYRADWIDELLLSLGIKPVIPSRDCEVPSRRPIEFDPQLYKQRNIVERLVGWLKEFRRVFSRFEKTAKNYAGMIKLAMTQLYLRWTE